MKGNQDLCVKMAIHETKGNKNKSYKKDSFLRKKRENNNIQTKCTLLHSSLSCDSSIHSYVTLICQIVYY